MRTRSGACYPCHAAPEAAAHRRKRQRTAAATEGSPIGGAAGRRDMFGDLPDDLVLSILADVAASAGSPADLAGAMLTCKRFRALGQNKLVLARASPRCLAVSAKAWSDDAHRFLQRCADAGNLDACYLLGMIRFYCLGDRGSGASLLASAAVGGHREALYSLAVIQFNGSGGSKEDRDLRAGAALCARAASLGHVDALREFGHCLQDGYGVRRSVPDGRRLLLQANARELAAARNGVQTVSWLLRAFDAEAAAAAGNGGGVGSLTARRRKVIADQLWQRELFRLHSAQVRHHTCLLSEFGCRATAGAVVAATAGVAPHAANRFLVDWFASHPLVVAGTGSGAGTGTGAAATTAEVEVEDGVNGGLRLCSQPLCGRPETRRHEFRRCSLCGEVNYCSRACQALHWKMAHKSECTPVERWLQALYYPNAAAVAAAAGQVAVVPVAAAAAPAP